ncbi:MAG: ADP-ribose pyrophosphatase [Chlamydiae bacterium]|nr:ADP-ribose pyrophosphatase [Chlamydiota bacterium]
MEHSLKQKELESQASVHSKEIYQGKIFTLRRDTLQFDALPPHDWDIILHPGAVALIPVNEKGNLLLIQQWRRAIGKIIYELPAGTLDKEEPPLECAQRELQEETGYKANTLIPLQGFYSAPGFCTEYIHLFIAKDLTESSLPGDIHEAIDVVEVSLEKALTLIDNNEIQDAKTICGILRYHRYLNA